MMNKKRILLVIIACSVLATVALFFLNRKITVTGTLCMAFVLPDTTKPIGESGILFSHNGMVTEEGHPLFLLFDKHTKFIDTKIDSLKKGSLRSFRSGIDQFTSASEIVGSLYEESKFKVKGRKKRPKWNSTITISSLNGNTPNNITSYSVPYYFVVKEISYRE